MKVKELNSLKKLADAGQSPWYDNIDRRLIKDGSLKDLFNSGLLGVTSNPTIFEKAVSSSNEYDAWIKKLAGEGRSALEIYNELTIKDIREAADLLRETYEKSNHLDGYVSIEVLPEFAHDAARTVESGREIFKSIGRPNIMIKVPGTKEGPDAIRELIKEGINVNVTLLFSVKHYELCARAYIAGLKERLKKGNGLKSVFSVASVFVSRVDTLLDKGLEGSANENLKGKIAVANSKMIYQKFKELFYPVQSRTPQPSGRGLNGVYGKDFSEVKKSGANLQRVLWASTSTKNPNYRDVKYVEELIGPDTINTMPPATVGAFLDHGKVEQRLDKGLAEEKSYLEAFKNAGMSIDKVCQEIQDKGVAAFQESFNKLILSIKNKM